MKFKRHLLTELLEQNNRHLRYFQGHCDRCVTMAISSKTVIPASERNQRCSRPAASAVNTNGCYCSIILLDAVRTEIKKMAASCCSFQDGVALVRPESKRRRSWSRSRYFQTGVRVGVARNQSTPQPWQLAMSRTIYAKPHILLKRAQIEDAGIDVLAK